VEIRERLSVPEPKLAETIVSLKEIGDVEGVSLLSTCNRVEVIVSASKDDVVMSIVDWLARRAGTSREMLEQHLYILRYADVVTHLFRVAAGLDSMIVGEPQIGGQVRRAFQASSQVGSLDSLLQQLFEQTMRVSKRIRTETGIGEHPVSVPNAAVELARKIFGDLRGLRVLLLGAGDMGELTAENLHKQQVRQVFVANRSYERAVELARRFDGRAVLFEAMDTHLAECDVVIASTAAPHFVIEPFQVTRALEARQTRSLFFIDLSVPRNINPAIASIEGAYLYNIDDLQGVADANLEARQREARGAETIVTNEVAAFQKRLIARDAVPTIVELQNRLETIRTTEIEKCLRRLGPISAEQRKAIEAFSTQIVNKILHYPILQLKESSGEPHVRRTIRKMFGLA
jgi:glutamyl-tRNA reductase